MDLDTIRRALKWKMKRFLERLNAYQGQNFIDSACERMTHWQCDTALWTIWYMYKCIPSYKNKHELRKLERTRAQIFRINEDIQWFICKFFTEKSFTGRLKRDISCRGSLLWIYEQKFCDSKIAKIKKCKI